MLYYLAITNSGDIEIYTVTVAETLVKVWYKIAFDFEIKFYINRKDFIKSSWYRMAALNLYNGTFLFNIKANIGYI